jgi:hypothetical protein
MFTGFDANERKYSNPRSSIERRTAVGEPAGTSYSTSPDLSFGVQGLRARQVSEIPHRHRQTSISTRSPGATTKWQASGNSTLDASVGYTRSPVPSSTRTA